MKSPFVLVPDSLSNDTIECLESMLDQARRGQIIGVAFVAMLKRRSYIVNTTGEAQRNPTFTLGMLHALQDRLGQRVQGGNPA